MANTVDIDRSLRLRIVQQGHAAFGPDWDPQQWSIAPGRLELLGNHVDYNGGVVLAGAVDRVVAIGIDRRAEGQTVSIVAGDVSPAPFDIEPALAGHWQNTATETGPHEYALGVLAALAERGVPSIRSGQLSVAGNVPLGFGMSSSAALCVSLTLAFAESDLSEREIVTIAQDAEHRAGSPVGAMDQSASVAGGVILFDGSDTSFRRLEPDLGNYVFAVADSGIHHAIRTSAYPVRVQESQLALERIRESVRPGLTSLGALSPEDWAAIKNDHPTLLGDVLTRRVEHVISEVERVREGIVALESGDWVRFGGLMTASGRSSATDYDISHPQVEELVAELQKLPGVLGARMMGGGEGGPALALLHRDAVDDVAAAVARGFFSRNASDSVTDRFQVCVFGEGARKR